MWLLKVHLCLGYLFFINRLLKRAAWNVYNLFKIKADISLFCLITEVRALE